MTFLRLAALASALTLAACAKSTVNWKEPFSKELPATEATVQAPFDDVWDRLVKNLAQDFFVINNIEKQSRIINVSFSASRPSEYVDCGFTRRTFENARGKANYNYNTADSAQYTAMEGARLFNYTRSTSLSGRSNVYVEPTGEGTKVSVNTKYVLTLTLSALDASNRPAGSRTDSIDFTTRQRSTANAQFYCVSKGNLEERILNYVRR